MVSLAWMFMLTAWEYNAAFVVESKGELKPKIKFVLFERTLKITE